MSALPKPNTSPNSSCRLFHVLYIFSSSLCYVPTIPDEHVLILTFYQCQLFDNHTLLRIPPCRLFYVHWNHSLLTAKKKRKQKNIVKQILGKKIYSSSWKPCSCEYILSHRVFFVSLTCFTISVKEFSWGKQLINHKI